MIAGDGIFPTSPANAITINYFISTSAIATTPLPISFPIQKSILRYTQIVYSLYSLLTAPFTNADEVF